MAFNCRICGAVVQTVPYMNICCPCSDRDLISVNGILFINLEKCDKCDVFVANWENCKCGDDCK